MIQHEGRCYVISKNAITDSHGNTHGWFCRVQSEDGQWRVVTHKYKLEKFRLQGTEDGITEIVEEVTEGLVNGTLIVEKRPVLNS